MLLFYDHFLTLWYYQRVIIHSNIDQLQLKRLNPALSICMITLFILYLQRQRFRSLRQLYFITLKKRLNTLDENQETKTNRSKIVLILTKRQIITKNSKIIGPVELSNICMQITINYHFKLSEIIQKISSRT